MNAQPGPTSADRRQAVSQRLLEAWAALEGARSIADNNGLIDEATEIAELRARVSVLEHRLRVNRESVVE